MLTPDVVVINLARRPDRRAAFLHRWQTAAPGAPPVRIEAAVDTGDEDGCLASHLRALVRQAGPVLVFEDDACFSADFTLQLQPPPDWDVLWLGGQHHQPPLPVSPTWARVRRMVRTHAYIAREPRLLAAMMIASRARRLDPYMAMLPLNQYVLRTHTVGQAAGASDLGGGFQQEDQYWNVPGHHLGSPVR